MGSENSGVVVIGGGPSGLACAWRLAREGRRVTVLEAEDRPGGLCATYEKDGFRFDLGGHRFVSADTELSSRVRAWMGDDLLVRERRSAVLHDGRHFHYPLEAGDLVRSLGVAENARAMLGYAVSRAQRPFAPARSRDDSFDAWVRARFGNYLYNTFFGPYSEKLWGISPSAISADWAEERIGLLDLSDAALRMAGLRRTKVRTYARRYEYPRLGMGQLFARVAEDAQRAGARIELGARVTGLVVEGDRIREVIARRAGHGTPGEIGGDTLRFRADAVYATSPLPEIARQLVTVNGALPAQSHVTDAAARLRFRALRFLNLCLRGERVQDVAHSRARASQRGDVPAGTRLAHARDAVRRGRRALGDATRRAPRARPRRAGCARPPRRGSRRVVLQRGSRRGLPRLSPRPR
jgi:protoporphyrinogen oxidase